MEDYDLIIIGGGIAGLTAAIYAARARLKTLVLEKHSCGGLANSAVEIENFPSHEKIGGQELMERVVAQAEKLGAEIREIVEISSVHLDGVFKVVETDDGTLRAKAIIVATGREPIRLPFDVPGEHIHYCAICDGAAYRDREILVVGGGNSGVGDALYLLNQGVRKLTLIEQMDRLFADQTRQEALRSHAAVKIMTGTEITDIEIVRNLYRVTLQTTPTGKKQTIDVGGIFVYMGQEPRTEMFRGLLEMDEKGYILGDETMRTNLGGVFVAGDVRQKKYRQLTTAMNDGTIAALEAEEYLRSMKSAASNSPAF